MIKLLLVGGGGFLGSVARYLVSGWVYRLLDEEAFPFGTLAVNVAGCLLIGLLSGLAEARQVLSPEARLFVLIGFLGGFTTFSTFGFETFVLVRGTQIGAALLNVGLSVLLGLAAVWAGYVLARLL